MIETSDMEIDVEQLMSSIRRAVEQREAEGNLSLTGASVELYELLATSRELADERVELPPLSLQPEFEPHEDDHYHVNDLLQYHDHLFVWNAYRAILKREPDEEGLNEYLGNLRSGRFNKIDVLASLRFSGEGKGRGVRIDGLQRPALLRRLYRVPVLGYLLELVVSIVRLPALLRGQRQLENYLIAQQERLAAYINHLYQPSSESARALLSEIANVSEEQKSIARLQQQQVLNLFREQRAISERLQQVNAEIDSRLDGLRATIDSHAPARAQPSGASITAEAEHSDLHALFASFTEQFRGDRETVKENLKVYLPFLRSAAIKGEILDLGCGRGEWLELLQAEGWQARGVETNRVFIEQNQQRGLPVVEDEALAYLRRLPDNSLGAVTAFHLVEHLSFPSLIELLDEVRRTLWPGGLVIFETPNPKNLIVGACNFYSDPTHRKPLFPETLQFIMQKRGFADVRIEYLNPVTDSPFDDEQESTRALNSWFYGPRDFALIGRRAES
jgi:SAM-dependent methyltransferase